MGLTSSGRCTGDRGECGREHLGHNGHHPRVNKNGSLLVRISSEEAGSCRWTAKAASAPRFIGPTPPLAHHPSCLHLALASFLPQHSQADKRCAGLSYGGWCYTVLRGMWSAGACATTNTDCLLDTRYTRSGARCPHNQLLSFVTRVPGTAAFFI